MCPTSSQWGIPRMLPLYPVERMVRSRTTTAPTCLRSQVARVATCFAMSMKYWSHELLAMEGLNHPPPTSAPPRRLSKRAGARQRPGSARVTLADQEEDGFLRAGVAVPVALSHRRQGLPH